MISAIAGRRESFSDDISEACLKVMSYIDNDCRQRRRRAQEAADILRAINAIFPIMIGSQYDLYGELPVRIEASEAPRVIQSLHAAGYTLSDASYTLADEKDIEGNDQVNVQRMVEKVEGIALESSVGRLLITWLAPYEDTGKCKIVEQKNEYTTRSLVCNGE